MRYCIVLEDGQIIDINDYDILWLDDDEIDELRECVPNEYIEDAAYVYHEIRMAALLNNLEKG